ncbi:MAG: hypothetical protein JXR36_08235 [Bacteroidales bacterium]|nr:hypothetical protein [Bacteroidales bacterium]
MKKIKFLFIAAVVATFFSCGGGTSETADDTVKDTTANETESPVKDDGKIDPFKDFPDVGISAKAGDYILTPSLTWQQDATTDGPESTTFIFYSAKMSEPGDDYSVVDFTFDDDTEIPNYMIIPIKSGQTASVGDIVLTWWQSGSGMQRAIVTDASDPLSPEVNYIDISWTNPAKNSDGVPIGQQTEKIKANSFHILKNKWEPGTSVAVKKDLDYYVATLVCVSGDKVLTIGWAGAMKVYDKEDCFAIEIKPNLKVGDQVQAPWVGKFVNTEVVKVDTKLGRVWCDDPYSDDPMVVPFGDVTTGLDIK